MVLWTHAHTVLHTSVCTRSNLHACTQLGAEGARKSSPANVCVCVCVCVCMQCEAMQASLTRLGTQYRAFFTWLLKIGESNTHTYTHTHTHTHHCSK